MSTAVAAELKSQSIEARGGFAPPRAFSLGGICLLFFGFVCLISRWRYLSIGSGVGGPRGQDNRLWKRLRDRLREREKVWLRPLKGSQTESERWEEEKRSSPAGGEHFYWWLSLLERPTGPVEWLGGGRSPFRVKRKRGQPQRPASQILAG